MDDKTVKADLMVVQLDRARTALAEAKTIGETKKIMDMAHAAQIYARRQQLGEEAMAYALAIKIEAMRKLGEILQGTPRNEGGKPIPNGNRLGAPATLSELGIDLKTSMMAQQLAAMPDAQFEQVREGVQTVSEAMKTVRAAKTKAARGELAQTANSMPCDKRWHLSTADIQTHTTSKRFDYIITDPPYLKEYLHLYDVLAKRALDWLEPDGLLVVMCGQSYLAQIYALMAKHLSYYWTGCYLTPGQPTPLRARQVNTTWKPLLMFTKPDGNYKGKIFGDVFKSDSNDKRLHEWGQSESGMSAIVSGICLPGTTILDPFLGAGTTGVAAIRHGCLFTGFDVDAECVKLSHARITNDTATTR